MSKATADGDIVYWGHLVPVGGIISWVKSLTGVPALGQGWHECDGSVLSDAESPLNGQTLPNLNGSGTYRMLRGADTSGGTGGADTHTLTTTEIPAHRHTVLKDSSQGSGDGAQSYSQGQGTFNTGNTGGGGAHNNLPAWYGVVWIIRIK
jgi:microcystin-dependent protein